MEKEMKKLLLVAVSVGVFLLVTVTVSIILLTQRNQPLDNAVSSYSQGRVQPAADFNYTAPAVSEQPSVTPNNNTAAVQAADSNNGDNITIQIPLPSAASNTPVPTSTAPIRVTSAPAPAASSTSATTASSSSLSSSSSSQSSSSNTASSTASSRSTAATTNTTTAAVSRTTSANTTRTITDYWIQIGAYSAMVRAEDVRESLASKGLISIIENREISGDNLYRVRLGPYTSEREANHWLAIVQAIDGFSDSQVRQTTRQQ